MNKHGRPYGQLFWNLLGELHQTIQNTAGSDADIQFSTVLHAISMLHKSNVIICSVSTSCFFSPYGSNVGYQPAPVLLLRYPENTKISNGSKTIDFSTKLLSPKDFPHLNSEQVTYVAVNSTG